MKLKKLKGENILKGFKMILFMIMMFLSYMVSDRVVDYLLTVDVIILKRVLNLILVSLLVFMASKNKNKNK
jgi:small neutral amino acid transporter SnatA (MarC family)